MTNDVMNFNVIIILEEIMLCYNRNVNLLISVFLVGIFY